MVAAALLLALTIVGVAALVNTAAFDDARATQAQSDAAWESLEYRDEVATGLGGVVRVVNNDSEFDTYRDLNDSFGRTTRDWARLAADHYAIAGVGAGAPPSGTVNGTRIAQNVSKNYESPALAERNWTVARGINDTRQFRMNVTNDSLRVDQGFGGGPRADYHTSEYFRVNLTQPGGPTRGVYLYGSAPSADRVFVRVDRGPDRGMSRRCSATPNVNGRLTVHLTNRKVGDTYCAPLRVFDTVEDGNYSLRYGRGDQVSGSYELYVDDNRSEVLDVQGYSNDGSSSPFVENATYAGLARLDYETAGVDFAGTIAATPDDLRPLAGGDPFTPPALSGDFITYRTSGIRSLNHSGTERSYTGGGTGNADGIGPSGIDVDSDGIDEVPFKKGSDLKIISQGDGPGNTDEDNVIASDQIDQGEQMTYGVDVWDGDGSVFYPRDDGGGTDALGRAWCDGDCSNTGMVTTQQETITQGDGNGVHSVAGAADLNNDSLRDIVYVDRGDPHAFHFWDNGSTTRVDRTSVTVPNTSSTTPPAIGTPADFDGDGFARVPFVNSTGGIQLVNLTTGGVGNTERVSPDGTATETPMAVLDWDGDADPEIVYLEAGTNELRLIDDVTGANTDKLVTDNSGNAVSVDPEFGVR